jgi:hypothetical protein
MHPTIILAGQEGYLFEGKAVGTYCFVPRDQVRFTDDGNVGIDEVRYFSSGWALRNMRATPVESAGTYLFPKSDRLISNLSFLPVRQFLSALVARSAHPFAASVAPQL